MWSGAGDGDGGVRGTSGLRSGGARPAKLCDRSGVRSGQVPAIPGCPSEMCSSQGINKSLHYLTILKSKNQIDVGG